MKSSEFFAPLLGNAAFKERAVSMLDGGRLPHAIMICAQKGCGRNFAARLLAGAYLGDENGLVGRSEHPDCIELHGSGASGNIPVEDVRAALFEVNKSAVMSNGRRVVLIRDAKNLNVSSSNSLLKTLEAPPEGVLFILTALDAFDVIETVRSRVVPLYLLPLSGDECESSLRARFPEYDRARITRLCSRYCGRLGLALQALSSPERLAISDAAERFVSAALRADKLGAISALDGAANRDELRELLSDAEFCLDAAVSDTAIDAAQIERLQHLIIAAREDNDSFLNQKLLCTQLAAGLYTTEKNK